MSVIVFRKIIINGAGSTGLPHPHVGPMDLDLAILAYTVLGQVKSDWPTEAKGFAYETAHGSFAAHIHIYLSFFEKYLHFYYYIGKIQFVLYYYEFIIYNSIISCNRNCY